MNAQVTLVAGGTALLVIAFFIDRGMRWYGARRRTRLFIGAAPVASLVLFEISLLTGLPIWLAEALLLIMVLSIAAPRLVIKATGGALPLVELGEEVRVLGQAFRRMYEASTVPGDPAELAGIHRRLEGLTRWETAETAEYIALFRERAEHTLTGTAWPDDGPKRLRFWELERGFRDQLDRAGVGKWIWQWANAEHFIPDA